jgi:beta-phosphoglucomutase-like phosphatase (HAD superfamily)
MFDMDGLLVDTEPIWYEVETEVMARLGGTWSPADQAQLVGGSLTRSVRYLLAKAAPPASGSGPPPAAGTVARWMVDGMIARIAANGVTLLPGAAELLAEVAAAGLPCALVTSSHRAVMDAVLAEINSAIAQATGSTQASRGGAISHAGVHSAFDTFFHTTVCAEDVTNLKPDPEPYLLAAVRLRADPARCVVLEDAPTGVAAAQAAGCLVVAVPSVVPLTAGNGRTVVRSLRDVSVPWIRELATSRDSSIPQ